LFQEFIMKYKLSMWYLNTHLETSSQNVKPNRVVYETHIPKSHFIMVNPSTANFSQILTIKVKTKVHLKGGCKIMWTTFCIILQVFAECHTLTCHKIFIMPNFPLNYNSQLEKEYIYIKNNNIYSPNIKYLKLKI